MKLFCAAVVLVVSGQIAKAQDFTVRMNEGDGKTSIYYVSRNAVRSVESSPIDTDVIYRLDTGKIITVDNKQKTYSETTLAEARQQVQKNSGEASKDAEIMRSLGINPGAVTVTKIGTGEPIAGYPTEKYSTKTAFSQGEIWVTPALEFPAGYYDMMTTSVTSGVPGLASFFDAMKKQQVRGFLLKMVGTPSNPALKGITITRVATSVEKGPIAASTFEPPQGYRKVARTP